MSLTTDIAIVMASLSIWLVALWLFRDIIRESLDEVRDHLIDIWQEIDPREHRRRIRDANIARLERELGIGPENWNPIRLPRIDPDEDRWKPGGYLAENSESLSPGESLLPLARPKIIPQQMGINPAALGAQYRYENTRFRNDENRRRRMMRRPR